MIIDRADILGLAEMHQLRGRVGRYIHKAYAYFFKPVSRPVTPEAEKRLEVIERYSQLGAGFDIALRDLEIRGAGNILGPAQSGHIAAVGYNLYCRLLARAAARMKGEPVEEPPAVNINIGLDAFLPEDYIPTPRQRMDFYRQVNRATELVELRRVRTALEDRYGPLPPDGANLLAEAQVRILAARAGIDSIDIQDGRLHFGVRDGAALQKAFKDSPTPPRLVSPELAVVDEGFPREDPVALCGFLRDLLRGRRSRQS